MPDKLEHGTPLTLAEIQPILEPLKRLAAKQFIQLYEQWADRRDDVFLWGDEVHLSQLTIDGVCASRP